MPKHRSKTRTIRCKSSILGLASFLILALALFLSLVYFSSAQSITCDFGSPVGDECVGYLTSTTTTSWTVPADWDSAANMIELIGGGGGGADGAGYSNGGGGGAYSEISNQSLTPGASVAYAIGAGGSDTGTNGGNGGAGTEWDASHGAGGGGGGGGCASAVGGANGGGAGGLYGGGGGAGCEGDVLTGTGAQGIIVITYTPAGSGGSTGRIIRLIGGVRLVGGIRLGGNSPLPSITNGLVGWWKFDDGSGTTAADSSGNGNTGTLEAFSGSQLPTWTAGKINGALIFEGSFTNIPIVSIPDSASLDMGSVQTVAFWINGAPASQNDGGIFTKGQWGNPSWEIDAQHYTNTDVYARVDTSGGSGQLPLADVGGVLDNTWHQLVFVFNNGTVTSYEDGAEVSSSSYVAGEGFASPGSPLYIGSDIASTITLDDVRIYNRALSATEVAELYAY